MWPIGFMVAIAIIIWGTVGLVSLESRYLSKPKPRPQLQKVNWHRVREAEKEAGISPLSELKCGPDCKECRVPPKSKGGVSAAAPIDQLNKRVRELQAKEYLGRGLPKCKICETLVDNPGMCEKCEYRYKSVMRQPYQPRVREIRHQGILYRAHVPTDVPDNAHAEVLIGDGHKTYDGTWMHYTWTDQKTGGQMGLRTSAFQGDKYEVWSDQEPEPLFRYRSVP